MTELCRNGHDRANNTILYKDGKTRCLTCRRESWKRAGKKRLVGSVEGKKDGLEHEFGPIPPRDPNLIDWVVLTRIAQYGKAPRRLTPAEARLSRELGLYQGSSRDFKRPGWTFQHYGDTMVELKNETLGLGGINVSRIENQVLRILRETVSV